MSLRGKEVQKKEYRKVAFVLDYVDGDDGKGGLLWEGIMRLQLVSSF